MTAPIARDEPTPPSSRDVGGPAPRRDEERERQQAAIKDADKTDQADRDNVHGDGEALGLDRA